MSEPLREGNRLGPLRPLDGWLWAALSGADSAPPPGVLLSGPSYLGFRAAGRLLWAGWFHPGDAGEVLGRAVTRLREQLPSTDLSATDVVEFCTALGFHQGEPVPWRDCPRFTQNAHRGVVGYELSAGETDPHRELIAPTAVVATNRAPEAWLAWFRDRHPQADAEAVRVRTFSAVQALFLRGRPDSPVPLFRGARLVRPEEVTRELAERLERLLGDYLLGGVGPDGRQRYLYYPSRGAEDASKDNAVRQWLASWALCRTARLRGDERAWEVALRNLRYNLAATYRLEGGLGLIVEGDKVKLGAVALALLALKEADGRLDAAAERYALAATVQHLWQPSGRFRTFYRPAGRDDQQNFYPGEALLAWAALLEEGRSGWLLERFMASFRHYRRWHLANRNPAFVPWHTQAYYRVWRLTGEAELAKCVLEMNDWLLGVQQWEEAPYPDCRGRFYDPGRPFGPPHASSTGVYLEGLADAYRLAAAVGERERAGRYRRAILRGLRSVAQLTFKDEIDLFYVQQRSRLRGGVRTTEYNNAVRVDNVQHNLMAVQKVLAAFAAEDYRLPPESDATSSRPGPDAGRVVAVSPVPAGAPLWTAGQLAAITGARWSGRGADVTGLAYLPRRVKPGDLFVALDYEGTDYHRHVGDALARGAAAALVSRAPPGVPPGAPLLWAEDVRKALLRLGAAGRGRATGRFIAVTGRSGKTFTKDALSHVLGGQAPTGRTEGNDNDTTGVAISLARCRPDGAYHVIEVSMAHLGDDIAGSVRPKAKLVRPHVAVVTRVGCGGPDGEHYRRHHLEVAATKAQLFEGLEPGGTALVNRDDEHVFEYLVGQARACGVGRLWTFGRHPEADVCLLGAERCDEGFRAAVRLHGRELSLVVGVNGGHLLENVLAVLGAADAAGADLGGTLAALAGVRESPGRGNRYVVEVGGGTAVVLDYTRNATLPAVLASLGVLAGEEAGPGGRRVAVLGDMTELGGEPGPFHSDLAGGIEGLGIDLVFAAGEQMAHMYASLPAGRRGGFARGGEGLAELVLGSVRAGDVVLAQGARRLRLNRVVKALVGEANYQPWE